MTRHLVLGNGTMLVCIDGCDRVRDIYYPYVGQENHVSGHRHKTGIWVDGKFSWIFENPGWTGEIKYKKDSLTGLVNAQNEELAIKIDIEESVHYEKNIFIRKFTVHNLENRKREVRLFLNQHFYISESNLGDTVYYDPLAQSIVSYKGKRYFLIGGTVQDRPFSQYATGEADVHGKLGTYVDAEDGILSNNPVEHGSVDSTVGFTVSIGPESSETIYYWIAVGERHADVTDLHRTILHERPDELIKETDRYWNSWINKQQFYFLGLDEDSIDLFKRSLLIIRAETDKHGAVIAANDSDTLYFKRDTYSYMWPRDGALVVRSLDRVGHKEMTERFFEFCSEVISKDGFLLHKYRPDGSAGSSWHSWLKHGKVQLPIQEDETALVIDSLWKHYLQYKNNAFIKRMYKSFIKPAGDFLESYRDANTHLPKESYDLWEEKLGIHTFTCCTVFAGLEAVSNFARLFGTQTDAKRYQKAANEVRNAIITHLYDPEEGTFIKRLYTNDRGELVADKTIDSSTGYGIFEYKILPLDDDRVEKTMTKMYNRLNHTSGVGGLARYENDHYHRVHSDSLGNPWFISTLWYAEYLIAKAKIKEDLDEVKKIFNWVTHYSLPTGVLSEQIHAYTGQPLSVAPLTWSHAAFIIAVVKYLDKLEELGVCDPYQCSPSKKNKH